MKKLIILILVISGIGFSTFAQKMSRKEIKGNKHYFVNSFDKAIEDYNRADQLTMDGQRRLAESYHNLELNVESEQAYYDLVRTQTGVTPEDYYNYVNLLRCNGKYSESIVWMDKFAALQPNDLRSIDYMANVESLPVLLKDNGKYIINKLNVSSYADDFGACFYKEQIVFSSSRSKKVSSKKSNWTGKPFCDMYVANINDNQLETPEVFASNLNGKMHDGPASFSNDDTFMAFTKNKFHDESSDDVVEIQIYFSKYLNDEWATAEPFVYNNPAYSVGHPCLSSDGNTMYFTSDMPGGYGGADIYKTTRTSNSEWSKPVNMGNKINTEKDEMFPFYQEKNKQLFFTSNGRFGLGGLDIFICEFNSSEVKNVYNAGAPLNTQYDDFAAIVNEDMTKGYFASNKRGGSDDLYYFDILDQIIEKTITGIAMDKNKKPITGTFVVLQDDYSNLLDTFTTKKDGAYSFEVETDKKFKLFGNKVNYIEGQASANTFGDNIVIKADVVLLEKEVVVVVPPVVENNDLTQTLKLNNIYFDYNKSNIRDDAKTELDKIVITMNDNPNMIVKVSAYTDSRANESFNQILSNARAKSTVKYIQDRITDPDRISGKGYGESNLVNNCKEEGDIKSNCTEAQHQKNRRTEFIIVKNEAVGLNK